MPTSLASVVTALFFLVNLTSIAKAEEDNSKGWEVLTKIGWVVPDFREFNADFPHKVVVKPGDGWDTYNNKRMNRCLKGDHEKLPPAGGRVSYIDVYSHEDLTRRLNVSVSGSYGDVAKGAATFAQSVHVEKESRNILARATRQTGGIGLTTKYEIDEERLKELNDENVPPAKRVAKFRRECGDAFVLSRVEGMQLLALFQYALDAKELETRITASGSGKYAGVTASGSVDSYAKAKMDRNQTHFETSWLAGSGLPRPLLKSNDVVALLNDFAVQETSTAPAPGKISADVEATPIEMLLKSYRDIPSWPPGLKLEGVSPWLMKVLSEHARRLTALAERYDDAATQPDDYYTPFSRGHQDLRTRARALEFAAGCLTQVVNYCALNADCDPAKMLSAADLPTSCPMLSVAGKDEVLPEARRLLLAEPKENSQADGAVAKAVPALPAYKVPFLYYYYAYAAAPLTRSVKPGAGYVAQRRTLVDESRQVEISCDKDATLCKDVLYANLTSNAPPNDPAKAAEFEGQRKRAADLYRRFVLLTRINPMAAAACRETPQHPLCIDSVQREALVAGLGPQFGASHGFHQGSPPPPPPSKGRHHLFGIKALPI